MKEYNQDNSALKRAFKSGNKREAEQLLPHTRPVVISTTFEIKVTCIGEVKLVTRVTLLHLAAYWGWTDICALLVTWVGFPGKFRDEEGHVPLHYAAINGQLDMVKYLVVEKLCNPMETNNYNEMPLHLACSNGHLNIVQYLISELDCNPL